MKATLIFNEQAGAAAETSAEAIAADLARAGFRNNSLYNMGKDGLAALTQDPGDVVVVAGGDGSVRAVAGVVAGRAIPLVILPLGTANNIATALGLRELTPGQIIDGLSDVDRRAFDMGMVRSPWDSHYFLESAGVGLFAELLRAYDPSNGRSLTRALKAAARVVPHFAARDLSLRIDDAEVRGNYILVEAMNTPCLGMRTPIAPEADPTDGMLDIALVEEHEAIGLASYVRQLASGDPTTLPNWNVRRARRIVLTWDGSTVHADEELLFSSGGSPGVVGSSIEIGIMPRALEVWLPLRRNEGRCGSEVRPAAQAGSPALLGSDGELRAPTSRRSGRNPVAANSQNV